MLKDKIEKYFSKYQNIKVLLFFDPECNSLFEFEELNIQGVRKVKYENNPFALKTLLNGDWANDKIFLYFNIPSPKNQEDYLAFPLLDVLVANKEIKADDESDFMEEYGIQRHQREVVRKYMKELQFSSVQEVIKPILSASRFNEAVLIQGLLSAFVEFSKIEDWELIIGKIIAYTAPEKEKDFIKLSNKIQSLNILDFLNKKFSNYFNRTIQTFTISDISELIRILRYNAITRNLTVKTDDPYKQYKIADPSILASQQILIDSCLKHRFIAPLFQKSMDLHGSGIQEQTLFRLYGAEADYSYMPDNLIWYVINDYLKQIDNNPSYTLSGMSRLCLNNINSGIITNTLDFALYMSEMLRITNGIASYILDRPSDYISVYTSDYYRVDNYYRKSIVHFNKIDESEVPAELELGKYKDLLEKRYEDFLDKLNRNWLKCLSEINFDYSKIDAPKQYDFYLKEIISNESKTAVIISDALRYEVAQDLLTELHTDEKNQAKIRFLLSSLPSETAFGMANLLPGQEKVYKEGKVLIDGLSTDDISQRGSILKKANESSQAVNYDTVYHNNQNQNRELFKASVVYIYHDIIDKEGHKGNERNTFTSIYNAISEIKDLVKKLHSSYNISRVIITADHGFIYNDRKISDSDKDEFPETGAVESTSRYIIAKDEKVKAPGFTIPLPKTSVMTGEYYVVIPASVNRFKKQGGRYQFIHGGGSLQELIVPIIESYRKRQEIEAKVNPILVTKKLTIVSNTLKVQIYQQNKISGLEKERHIELGIYHESDLVSNEVPITLNATSDLPSERSYNAEFVLSSKANGKSILKLKIFDASDKLNPLIEEIVMNNTLIERDF